MVPALLIDTEPSTYKALPPEPPPEPGLAATLVSGFVTLPLPPLPPFPPRPTIIPLFISSTPPGKLAGIVRADPPVDVDEIYTPGLIVATTLEEPSQPTLVAYVCKLRFDWLVDIVNSNWLDLP
jgi:hypothetical protein